MRVWPANRILTPTGARACHHARSPRIPGMTILEKRNQAGDGRSNRAWSMAGRRSLKSENIAGHKYRVQAQDRQERTTKYMCRLITQGFRQVKGMNYEESSCPAPAQVSIRMVLGIIAILGWEAWKLEVDMAYLEANVEVKNARRTSGRTSIPRSKSDY